MSDIDSRSFFISSSKTVGAKQTRGAYRGDNTSKKTSGGSATGVGQERISGCKVPGFHGIRFG
jgi:hypothetical protein